jgi:ATP-binding cassette subfamily F protein 3
MLKGLGYRESDFTRLAKEMSGGWVMRAHLARLLVMEPDLLLLDEPTNHLDLLSLLWLQNYLKNYSGAVLLISHDRQFMDELITEVYDIADRKLHAYTGNYSDFLRQREERYEQQLAAYKNQQKEISALQEFADRFRSVASKASQAMSKLKQIERMELIEKPTPPRKPFRFQIPPPPRGGQRAISLQGIHMAYGSHVVYEGLDLTVERGERTVLVGPNGSGKSTLLKALCGLLPPASGQIFFEGRDLAGLPAPDIARLGIGYVPQGRGLFAGMTVAENLALGRLARSTDGSHGVAWSEEEIYEMFPRLKERQHVAADYLSGGEQQMAAVARALSGNVRLLLLDEPFEGLAPTVVQELFTVFDRLRGKVSIVIVEHNLDLVLALADRVFALERGAVFHQGPAEPLLNDLDYRKKILWL